MLFTFQLRRDSEAVIFAAAIEILDTTVTDEVGKAETTVSVWLEKVD